MSWTALLAADTVLADGLIGVADGAVAHFGDRRAETAALLGGEAVVVPLRAQGVLQVTGPDRVEFVNGQVSHDVRDLGERGVRLALMLDHRGQVQAAVSVFRRARDLYLAVDDGLVGRVADALDTHVVFDQVEIHRSRSLLALVASGQRVAELVGDVLATPDAGREALDDPERWVGVPFGAASVLLHARRRGAAPSIDLHLRSTELPPLWERFAAAGARPVGEVALAAARVAAGLAAASAEGAGALPQEAGLEDRISYRKGCYLGQEIMARVEARGRLRRGLSPLALSGAATDAQERAVLDADGRVVGRVGTAAELPDGSWRALAVLRRDLPAGTALRALGVHATAGASMEP